MTAAVLVHCDDCHRPVVVGPVLWDGDGKPYGPKCGRVRGLAVGRRARVRQPVNTGRAGEPVLDGLVELMETNESED